MKEGKSKEKISFLSVPQVKAYKVWLSIVLTMLGLGIGLGIYRAFTIAGYPGGVILGFLAGYKLFEIYRGIKAVEFDQEFLYVSEKGYEVIVPLDNIKNVEIRSLGGIYKVNFFDEIQSGHEIFFKPSLIYPLDFRKQDTKVNILRSNVSKAKRQIKAPLPKNALQS